MGRGREEGWEEGGRRDGGVRRGEEGYGTGREQQCRESKRSDISAEDIAQVTYRQSIAGKVAFSSKNSFIPVQMSSFKPLTPHPLPLALPHLQSAVLNAEELSGMQSDILVSRRRPKPWTKEGRQLSRASSNTNMTPARTQPAWPGSSATRQEVLMRGACLQIASKHKHSPQQNVGQGSRRNPSQESYRSV